MKQDLIRKPQHPINSNILNRRSLRSMSGESIPESDLTSLFEAARWAPSANNNQLTRFIYSTKNSDSWNDFLNLLADGNKIWCQNAYCLVVIISRKNSYYKNKPQKTHSFEAGSAFQNMALQGTSMGLVVHPMAGFDYDKTRELFNLDPVWNVECMVAIGKPGDPNSLPPDLQESEAKPSTRKPLDDIVYKNDFPGDS